MLSCLFSPDRPAEESSSEHPAKRLKVEPTDMVSEADITSLKKPNLDLTNTELTGIVSSL